MSSILKTKERLKSIRSTRKITKAMELVATSKLQKAREKADKIEAHLSNVNKIINTLGSYPEINSYLTKNNNAKKKAYILVGSDLGLCGPYNTNIVKKFKEISNKEDENQIYVIGSKLISKIKFEGYEIEYPLNNREKYEEIENLSDITSKVIDDYQNNKICEINFIYTKYISALNQKTKNTKLLPFTNNPDTGYKHQNIIFEPNPEELLNHFIHDFITGYIYAGMSHSVASEYSYRRNSMESANKNADEIIQQLNLKINRLRQANITQEISEIIGGSEALNKQ